MKKWMWICLVALTPLLVLSLMYASGCTDSKANANDNVILALMQGQSQNGNDDNARTLDLIKEGKETFRFDTFGDEKLWGDTLKLHLAIEGQKFGGVGDGVSPKTALSVGTEGRRRRASL